ncbi:hypothetical protein BpHYR1_045052 [Brachionus plicatilis]|uniref:Uncharacterized protein n=1 Tax=Brachionus plicatilis TaxID=10195 RepID=A0A3M7QLP1_BRAPC|nr:hypothetical protein BpHYR1_045052 [Brachionus plicatilis]
MSTIYHLILDNTLFKLNVELLKKTWKIVDMNDMKKTQQLFSETLNTYIKIHENSFAEEYYLKNLTTKGELLPSSTSKPHWLEIKKKNRSKGAQSFILKKYIIFNVFLSKLRSNLRF